MNRREYLQSVGAAAVAPGVPTSSESEPNLPDVEKDIDWMLLAAALPETDGHLPVDDLVEVARDFSAGGCEDKIRRAAERAYDTTAVIARAEAAIERNLVAESEE